MSRRNKLRALSTIAATVLTAASPAAFADPVTIETARGPVEVEQAERVVVFDIAALDTIDALGVEPVGVPDALYLEHLQHLDDKTEAVGTLFEPNFEAVAALEPDLIVVGGRSSTQLDPLAQIAPTIDMTVAGEGALVAEAKARATAYGQLFGREEAAAELVQDLDDTFSAAQAAVQDKGNALVLLTNGTKMSAFGPGSRFGWVFDELGLPSAVSTSYEGSHGESVSFEFVQKANPDWILVLDRAAAIGESAESARQTLDNALVHETTAWKEDHLVFLDPASMYIAMGGVRSISGLLTEITDAFEG